jgi:hypothetical protein
LGTRTPHAHSAHKSSGARDRRRTVKETGKKARTVELGENYSLRHT